MPKPSQTPDILQRLQRKTRLKTVFGKSLATLVADPVSYRYRLLETTMSVLVHSILKRKSVVEIASAQGRLCYLVLFVASSFWFNGCKASGVNVGVLDAEETCGDETRYVDRMGFLDAETGVDELEFEEKGEQKETQDKGDESVLNEDGFLNEDSTTDEQTDGTEDSDLLCDMVADARVSDQEDMVDLGFYEGADPQNQDVGQEEMSDFASYDSTDMDGDAVQPETREGSQNYYGFVVYLGDEAEPLDDGLLLIKSLGANWIQSEGPNVMSRSATWGLIEPSPGQFDFSSVAWVDTARANGVGVLLTVDTGHDEPSQPFYNPYVVCDRSIPGAVFPTNCVPKDYNHFYQFVYEVVRHFDGSDGLPPCLYFQSQNEIGSPRYFLGRKEDVYGGGETVVINRNNNLGALEVPAAWIPVAALATHDANPNARFVAGACTDGGGYPWAHLIEAYQNGATPQELSAIASTYNINKDGQSIIEEIQAGQRQGEFCLYSFGKQEYYDIYATHWYHTAGWQGFAQSMRYVKQKMSQRRTPVWVTGTGLLWITLGEDFTAEYLVKTLVSAYQTEVDWFDYSFLTDVAWPMLGLYTKPDYRTRHKAADAFSLLASLFRSRDSFEVMPVVAPTSDVLLYGFTLKHEETAGGVLIGFCKDNALGCPKSLYIGQSMDIFWEEDYAMFGFDGKIEASGCNGVPQEVTFAQKPFILVFGESADGDCIPDIVDNCPNVPNEDQTDAPPSGEIIVGQVNKAIFAPDGVGLACDNCPCLSNREQNPVTPCECE
jgi:hypothetical protein